MQAVLDWTGGQPFLTQKVCKLVLNAADAAPAGQETDWVENLVRHQIIENWEAKDTPEHLKTIRDRLLLSGEQRTGRLLGLYQQIVQQGEIAADDSPEQVELRLTGLVVKRDGKLQVYNHIYQQVFNRDWLERSLAELRPYGGAIAAWLESGCQDESRLLRGQALQDARTWAEGKSLGDDDYRFLDASQDLERREFRKKFEAQIKSNQILTEAKQKADLASQEAQQKVWLAIEEERKAKERLAEAEQETRQTIQKAYIERRIALRSRWAAYVVVLMTLATAGWSWIKVSELQIEQRKAQVAYGEAKRLAEQKTNEAGAARGETNRAKGELNTVKKEGETAKNQAEAERRNVKSLQGKARQAKVKAEEATSLFKVSQVTVKEKQLEANLLTVENLLSSDKPMDGLLFAVKVAYESQKDDFKINLNALDTLKKAMNESREFNRVYIGKNSIYPIASLSNGSVISAAQSNINNGGWDIYSWNQQSNQMIVDSSKETSIIEGTSKKPPIATFVNSERRTHIVTGHRDGRIRIRDEKGRVIGEPLDSGVNLSVSSVGVSEDGNVIVAGYNDGTIKGWRKDSKGIVKINFPDKYNFTSSVNSIAVSQNSESILASTLDDSEEETVKLWEAKDSDSYSPLIKKGKSMTSLAINSNSQARFFGAFGGNDGGLFIIKGLNDNPRRIGNHDERINSVAIISNNSLISSSDDGALKIWMLPADNEIKQIKPLVLRGHKGSTYSSIVGYNGKSIVSGGGDGTIRFWDLSPTPKGQNLLSSACNRLKKHSFIRNPVKDIEKDIKRICQQISKT